MPECYATKRGYLLECDKPLHWGGVKIASFPAAHFVNDPHSDTFFNVCDR